MGLIKAAIGSVGGVLSDQWKEYFYCEAMPIDILAVKGQKRSSGRSGNRGSDNIISNGSVIAVADGQCMIIVDQGRVAEVCAEPGEFVYDSSTEPTVFSGNLSDSIMETFANIGKRFTFGGEPPKDQRVYYINTRELFGNKYGTPSAVPFRVQEPTIGQTLVVSLRCFGEYSYRICDPLLFYKNVCGNLSEEYNRKTLESQMKTELMTALQPAFHRISKLGMMYDELPGHTMELADELNDILSEKWRNLRGIEIVSFGISSIKASEEDEKRLKQLQTSAVLTNPRMAAGHLANAQADAMRAAAENTSGAMSGFMGMGMAGGMGSGIAQLYQQAAQQQPQPVQQPVSPAPQPADGWTCPECGAKAVGKFCPECGARKPEEGWDCPSCGKHVSVGKFCPECGAKKPEPRPDGWVCPSCGKLNKGKFCSECGTKKPAGQPLYRCDKCGWEPKDPLHPPKFCPECGDPFDESDIT